MAAKDALISSIEAETKFLKNEVKDFEDQIKSEENIPSTVADYHELDCFSQSLADEMKVTSQELAHANEIEHLLHDIEDISKSNQIKEEKLATLSEENKKLKEKINSDAKVEIPNCDHCELKF